MAFLRRKNRGGKPIEGENPVRSDKVVRWVVVPGAGAAFALWSLATMAGVSSVGTSLVTASSGLPKNLFSPAAIALGQPTGHFRHAANAPAPSLATSAQRIVREGKSARRLPVTASAEERFARVAAAAALSPDKIAAAFARSGMAVTRGEGSAPVVVAGVESPAAKVAAAFPAPARERFDPALAEAVSLSHRDGPAAARFGPRVSEVRRSSRLALALAGASEIEIAFAAPEGLAGGDIALFPERFAALDPAMDMGAPAFDMPDSVPLPARRPRVDRDTSSQSQPAPKPAKRSKQSGEDMLAYAKPDTPSSGGLGQAFRNLFNPPSHGNGVAVYDISAATVTMPNGQKLEAHSGLGHMVDEPRYVREKNRGPTPPNTYNLVMRESRFHGVEAIRLIPADGKNKYGRDGLLAHTYMLRGGRAESNGCVVFKDYRRFLEAFKKGKVKRLVVVPGNSAPATQVASEGRGA
jgi:hypothetical protein